MAPSPTPPPHILYNPNQHMLSYAGFCPSGQALPAYPNYPIPMQVRKNQLQAPFHYTVGKVQAWITKLVTVGSNLATSVSGSWYVGYVTWIENDYPHLCFSTQGPILCSNDLVLKPDEQHQIKCALAAQLFHPQLKALDQRESCVSALTPHAISFSSNIHRPLSTNLNCFLDT